MPLLVCTDSASGLYNHVHHAFDVQYTGVPVPQDPIATDPDRVKHLVPNDRCPPALITGVVNDEIAVELAALPRVQRAGSSPAIVVAVASPSAETTAETDHPIADGNAAAPARAAVVNIIMVVRIATVCTDDAATA